MLVFSHGIPEQTWLKRDFKKPKKNFVKNFTISDFKDTMHTRYSSLEFYIQHLIFFSEVKIMTHNARLKLVIGLLN